MIWAIGLACAAGILVFHLINLARFRRQAFNQFELVAKIARQNRVIHNIQSLLLLVIRLALVGCLTMFIQTCAHEEKKAGSTQIFIPKLTRLTKESLGLVDSLVNRSGLATASKSNILTNDLRLKSLFPAISYQPEAAEIQKSLRKENFSVDSLLLLRATVEKIVRKSDTSFTFQQGEQGAKDIMVNGKLRTDKVSDKPVILNQESFSEVLVGDKSYFYFLTQRETPLVYLSPIHKELAAALNTRLFKFVKAVSDAQVLLGVSDFSAPIIQKAVLYIPTSAASATKDLIYLGVTAKVAEVAAPGTDTFDVLDKAYLGYAFSAGADVDLPIVTGKMRFTVDGYSIPIIRSSSGAIIASILPNTQGNTVLFLHTPLGKPNTNLQETELFLPLLYTLAKKVTQTGKVVFYDLCNKTSLSAISELSASADSLLYEKGFAKGFLGSKTERILTPGIYVVYQNGKSTWVAVNEIECRDPMPVYAYILRETTVQAYGNDAGWLTWLLVTFAVIEGLLLTRRLRRL